MLLKSKEFQLFNLHIHFK